MYSKFKKDCDGQCSGYISFEKMVHSKQRKSSVTEANRIIAEQIIWVNFSLRILATSKQLKQICQNFPENVNTLIWQKGFGLWFSSPLLSWLHKETENGLLYQSFSTN